MSIHAKCHSRKVFMDSLAGKTLFITGASRGIGRAIAMRAARDGSAAAGTGQAGSRDRRRSKCNVVKDSLVRRRLRALSR